MYPRRGLVISLVICVLISGIGFPLLGAGSALAQDGGDDVPSLPATYYGELEVTNGALSEPVLIEAVADGEVQDSIMTDENGEFGGPTISDEKLAVQPPEGEEVTFRVGDVVVGSVPFESGTQELTLNVSQEELAPSFNVTVTGSNSPVDGGEPVTVDATIENEGVLSDTQDISLVNASGGVLDSTSVSLEYNESTTVGLLWETDVDTSVTETFTVESANTTAPIDIEVERVTPPEIAPPPAPGGGGGGGTDGGDGGDGGETGGEAGAGEPDGDDTDDVSGVPPDVEALHTEQQTIVSDEELDLSQVRFTNESPVVSITWNSADIAGNVSVTTLNNTSNETGPAPGGLVSVSQLTVPDSGTGDATTIQFRADTSQIEELGAVTDDLQVYRFANNRWQQVDLIVIEESNETVVLQTETPVASYFAVSVTTDPVAEITGPTETTVNESISLNASNSTDQYGEIVSYDWTINGESYIGESVTTGFDQAGDVEVELTVENNAGATNTTTAVISVGESSDAVSGEDGGATDSSGDGEATDSSGNGGATDDGTPGFTAGLALLALLLSALIARTKTN